jgi:Fe-S-cluster containining protein
MQAQGNPLDAGRRFSCARCSSCCRHESGFVYISRADLTKLCGHCALDEARFIALYCRWVLYEDNKFALCLKEKRNFDCVFYADKDMGCAVYDARPVQCVTYPFWTRLVDSAQAWNDEAERCPGIAQGLRGRGELYAPERIGQVSARYARNTPLIKLEM